MSQIWILEPRGCWCALTGSPRSSQHHPSILHWNFILISTLNLPPPHMSSPTLLRALGDSSICCCSTKIWPVSNKSRIVTPSPGDSRACWQLKLPVWIPGVAWVGSQPHFLSPRHVGWGGDGRSGAIGAAGLTLLPAVWYLIRQQTMHMHKSAMHEEWIRLRKV